MEQQSQAIRRYRLVTSLGPQGSFTEFGATDDESAIQEARKWLYGDVRIVALCEVSGGTARPVQIP